MSKLKNKRVMVTGGAGFVGSHLCDKLLSLDNHVLCVDDLSTGTMYNITKATENSKFKFVSQNIINKSEYPIVDVIFHLASPASPIDYYSRPTHTLLTGSYGTNNIVEHAMRCNAKVVFTSTSEVYGDPKEHPQKETYWGNVNPIGPRSVYDEAKRFSEALIMNHVRRGELTATILRLFNTYGPRMRAGDGRVIPAFINQALDNVPLTVFGSGSQTRSFCYVDDLVNGLVLAAESEETGPTNMGNPHEEYTILEVAEKIISVVGSDSKIEFKSLPEDDPKLRNPDIARAKATLKWVPQVSFLEGIASTIQYFKQGIYGEIADEQRV